MKQMADFSLLKGGPLLRFGGLRFGGLRLGGIAAALAAIFAADMLIDFKSAVAVLYVPIILIGAGFLRCRGILTLSAVSIVLTFLSFVLTESELHDAGVANFGFSLCAIGVTAYLASTRFLAVRSESEARSQLARIARINSLGELTASIAHEVNQPLAAIVASGNAGVRWLAATPPNIEKARQAFERTINDANRTGAIVRRVRNLARWAPPVSARLEVFAVLDDVEILSKSERERHAIALEKIIPEAIPSLWADGVQIRQVLLNFILNAIEAMSETPAEKRIITIALSREGDRFVKFSVEDNGCGVAPKDCDKVFDAFYTTKPDGLGIGLAVSRSIIDAHGGRIWTEAREKGGARFSFTVPAYRKG